MPELARFYGIVIKMLFIQSEHPPPHIHAIYEEYISAIDINECKQLDGDLPAKAPFQKSGFLKLPNHRFWNRFESF
jgi:hypothetical protein